MIDHTRQRVPSNGRRLRDALRIAGLGCLECLNREEWLADDNAMEQLGLSSGGKPFRFSEVFRNVRPDDVALIEAALSRPPPAAVDVEFRVFDGGERVLHLIGGASSAAGVTLLLHDISARSAMENATIERITKADRLETLGALASGIAHEVNNPAQYVGDNLVFIRGAAVKLLDLAAEAEKAADGGDWKRVTSKLGTIKLAFLRKELPAAVAHAIEGIGRIGSIVHAIRDFCYPSTTASTLFDLNDLVEASVSMTRNEWNHVASLDLDLDESPSLIWGVEGEIMQVLINLIINAAQAIGEQDGRQQGRIVLRTRRLGEQVEIAVADTGGGIAEEDIGRIFDLFYTTKAPGKGTGQGLAISQAIVARHNGRILVESGPEAGTVFRVLLPAAN